MKRLIVSFLLFTPAFATVHAANPLPPGPHFIITVPVRLANLPPEITGYRVGCAVTESPTGTPGIVARGEVTGDIKGGAVNTDVVVNLTVTNALRDPGRVTDYQCSLHLYGPNPSGSGGLVYMDGANVRMPLAPGAPVKRSAYGRVQ